MKKNFKYFLLSCALVITNISQAAMYEYSYTFQNGEIVSGSFMGDLDGNLITNLSDMSINVSLPYRPPASFPSTQPLSSFQAVQGAQWNVDSGGVLSLDGHFNSFAFVAPGIRKNFLYAYSQENSDDNLIMLRTDDENIFLADTFQAKNWTVSAVPEAGSGGMLLAGLCMFAAVTYRRRPAQG